MHAPYPVFVPGYEREQQNAYLLENVVPKSFKFAHFMGIPYMVIHPWKLQYDVDKKTEIELNLEYFKSLTDIARRNNVVVCLENLYGGQAGRIVEGPCADPEEAVYLIDTLNDYAGEERFAFCLDTGHMNLVGRDAYSTIMKLGKRIKILHLHDNDGIGDLHQMPYTFNAAGEADLGVDWKGVIKGLRETGYDGTLSFETFPCMNSFPDRMKQAALNTLADIGRYLKSEIEEGYIYDDIFHNVEKGTGERKKVYIFGTGKYADKFVNMYKDEYPPEAYLDNNEEKQGTELKGVKVLSPEVLKEVPEDSYHVFICIKNYEPVIKQLQDMGVSSYSVYDIETGYPYYLKPTRESQLKITAGNGGGTVSGTADLSGTSSTPGVRKRYHVGYLAGVFDLYHVGHLNMFRRAKEMCDYLIVGVVSDESVRRNPNKSGGSFIPFEERIELVRSCKYVDQAEEIPTDYPGTEDAWRKYHFDVQFSGSDYANDPAWLNWKKFLEERGSTIEFFPYTECTSSTKLKGLIDKKLLST